MRVIASSTLEAPAIVAGLEVAGQAVAMSSAERRRHDQLGHVLADDIVSRVPEHLLGCGIELHDAARLVHRDHGVERRAENRSGQCFALPDGTLGTSSDDELADEVPKHRHRGKQGLVRRLEVAREELHRADDLAGASDREAERGAQTRPGSYLRTREVGVRDHIDDPGRLTAGPDPARQPFAAVERGALGERPKLEHVRLRCVPNGDAAEVVAGRDLPRGAKLPSESSSDVGQDPVVGLPGIGGLRQGSRDRELDARQSRQSSFVAVLWVPDVLHLRQVWQVRHRLQQGCSAARGTA